MNPTYTYNGVSYTDDQKNLILADQKVISDLQSQVRGYENDNLRLDGEINNYMAAVASNGSCYNLSGVGGNLSARQKCIDSNNNAWSQARNDQSANTGRINSLNSDIQTATTKLNNDIITIQNDIKFQIQAQTSNVNASNSPATISGQNALALQNIKNQADKEKEKQKLVGFGIAALLIFGIVYVLVSK